MEDTPPSVTGGRRPHKVEFFTAGMNGLDAHGRDSLWHAPRLRANVHGTARLTAGTEDALEITRIESFLGWFDNVRARTLRVARCIPPEHIEWRAREGGFSFGDLLRHLGAMERWMFAENVNGRQSRYAGCGTDVASGLDGVLEYLEQMHEQATALFAALTPADLQRKCETPGGISITSWKWLRSMAEHEIHHRGQIYLMLGLLGVETPPLYGLTAEEVQARSLP
jgi:uncharacterized damage-inducible protein DinB